MRGGHMPAGILKTVSSGGQAGRVEARAEVARGFGEGARAVADGVFDGVG